MFDHESLCPRAENGYLFNPDKQENSIQQYNIATFNHFKDQASAILGIRYCISKNQIIQHLPVKE